MIFDEPFGAIVELAASRHNAFHSTEAAEMEVSSRRLRSAAQAGVLKLLHPKVWAFPSLGSPMHQATAGATLAVYGGAAGFTSAAALHGWIERPPSIPQVWAPTKSKNLIAGIETMRAAKIDPDRDITNVAGVRTLNAAATLCLLGTTERKTVVERCLDEFLRSHSERWLHDTLARLMTNRPAGPAVLALIISDQRRVRGITDSWLERVLAKLVALDWLPPMVLQHPIEVGDRRFRIDIACPELKLGIEAHSRTYHFGRGKEDADNVRDLLVSSQGWQLLYVTHSQLLQPDQFVRQFEAAARARAIQMS